MIKGHFCVTEIALRWSNTLLSNPLCRPKKVRLRKGQHAHTLSCEKRLVEKGRNRLNNEWMSIKLLPNLIIIYNSPRIKPWSSHLFRLETKNVRSFPLFRFLLKKKFGESYWPHGLGHSIIILNLSFLFSASIPNHQTRAWVLRKKWVIWSNLSL